MGSNCKEKITETLKNLQAKLGICDLGCPKKFLVMNVSYNEEAGGSN